MGILRTIYEGSLESLTEDVDIVFVHGLERDPRLAWGSINGGASWIEDPSMLPSIIPQSRILAAEYIITYDGTELHTIVEQLIYELCNKRKMWELRPIIFIGHSLGGHVIIRALNHAASSSEGFESIVAATAGVIFLGTPLRGSGLSRIGDIVARVTKVFDWNKSLDLKQLKNSSDLLSEVIEDFVVLAKRVHINTICFYEMRTVGPLQGFILVDESSACLDGHGRGGLDLGHFQLNKFYCTHDTNYLRISAEIARITRESLENLHNFRDVARGVSVDTSSIHPRLKLWFEALQVVQLCGGRTAQSVRTQDLEITYSWILENETFKAWLEDKHSTGLWISDMPNSGKTTLSLFLVDKLVQRISLSPESGTMMAYFVCGSHNSKRSNAAAILRTILYQFLQQKPFLIDNLQDELRYLNTTIKEISENFRMLWKILCHVLRHFRGGTAFIIIDGLDECDSTTAETLLLEFNSFLRRRSNDAGRSTVTIKIILSSQENLFIKSMLGDIPKIWLTDKIAHEVVRQLVDTQLEELAPAKGYNNDLKLRVIQAITERAQGSILWAGLVCQQLWSVRPFQALKFLEKVPTSISQIYDATLSKVLHEEDPEVAALAQRILLAVLISFRPLHIRELAIVADLPDADQNDPRVFYQYLDICRQFIEISSNDTVSFLHTSIGEYFASHIVNLGVPEGLGGVHAAVSKRCLRYITTQFSRNGEEAEDGGTGFEAYPVEFWVAHMRAASIQYHNKLDANHEFFRPYSPVRDSWIIAYWPMAHESFSSPKGFSLLHFGAYVGVAPLFAKILRQTSVTNLASAINAVDSMKRTPISYAAEYGRAAIVKAILNTKLADSNRPDLDGQTPLMYATVGEHEDIVAWYYGLDIVKLLPYDIRNPRNQLGMTALDIAAEKGQGAIVQRLLKVSKKSNRADQEELGVSLLIFAAANGHASIVKLLLGVIPDEISVVDFPNIVSPTFPVSSINLVDVITSTVTEPIISLLIEKGADVSAKNCNGQTALLRALDFGLVDVVKLLLGKNDPQAIDIFGNTAIHGAAKNGNRELILLLIHHGSKLDNPNNIGKRAIHEASINGHEEIVQILLDCGADIEKSDNLGQTPLHVVAGNGNYAIMGLLLNSGDDPMRSDRFGFTPLHWAVRSGNRRAISLLLDRGADTLAQNVFGNIALPWVENARLEAHLQKALDLINPSIEPTPREMNDLSNWLQQRFLIKKDFSDLLLAITHLKIAIADPATGNDERRMYYYNLARALKCQFLLTRWKDHLDDAVKVADMIVQDILRDDLEFIRYQSQLCELHLLKYLETREESSLQSSKKTAELIMGLKGIHKSHPLAEIITTFARKIVSLGKETESSLLVEIGERFQTDINQNGGDWISGF